MLVVLIKKTPPDKAKPGELGRLNGSNERGTDDFDTFQLFFERLQVGEWLERLQVQVGE